MLGNSNTEPFCPCYDKRAGCHGSIKLTAPGNQKKVQEAARFQLSTEGMSRSQLGERERGTC